MDYSLPTEFDLIVVGTGVVESIVSAAASRIGKRVLHVDINNYYGGHWASFNLEDIQKLKDSLKEDIKTFNNGSHHLAESENTIVTFSNKLKKFQHFDIKWHVSVESSCESENLKSLKEISQLTLNKDESSEDTTQYNPKTIDHDQGNDTSDMENDNLKENPKNEESSKNTVAVTQEKLKNDYRKFVIDLCPKLHFARGDFVELLISSNIARYAEFRSVSRVLTWINGNIEVVPCSRSDVFANNRVSVVEKRMLMKLLTSIESEEKNITFAEGTKFKEFLKGKKLSNNLIHFVLYALSMSTDETLWLDGVQKTKRFLSSLGRFGKTPFLFSMYGSGEITQAFCRLSAVFGGIFALNQTLHGIELDKNNKFISLLCGNQKISAAHMIMDVGLAPENFFEISEMKFISRAIFITDRSLMYSEQEHLSLLLYPSDDGLCTVLELGNLTGTCPKNLFLVHLTTRGNRSPQEDLKNCVNDLFALEKLEDDQSRKPNILWSCYLSIPDTNEVDLKCCVPKNILLCPGPDLDLDYDNAVKKAKDIFSEMYPNEEFLPRAPDADEIVIENDPESATEVKIDDIESSCSSKAAAASESSEDGLTETEIAIEVKPTNSDLMSSGKTDEMENATGEKVDECLEARESLTQISQ